MKKMIHHIRRQPKEVRRHILHVLTIIAAIILLLLWVYSLGTRLSNTNSQAKIKNDLKPFSALKGNIISGYKSISEPSTNAGATNQENY